MEKYPALFEWNSADTTSARMEAQMTSLLERLSDGVLMIDREWRVIYANPAAMRISRLRPEDLNSRTHWELYPETVGTVIERMYRDVMNGGEDALIVYYHEPFDVWLDIHIFSIKEGIALHYSDVTGRMRAEQARDESMRKLEQVMAAITDSVVCIDRDWNCTFANDAALKILQTDSLIGENLWTRFPGNNEEPFASNYRATMERRVSTEFEAYYAEPLDIWFRVSAHPFEDGIIILSSDITEWKHAEALREAAARRLAQVLEVTTDCVVTLDRSWRYSFVNGRAAALLQRFDLLGKNLWEEFPEAIHSQAPAFYQRCMDNGVPCDFEDFYPEPLNLWLSQQCRPYDDGIAIFFRDTTEERKSRSVYRQQRDLITFVQQSARIAFWTLEISTGKLEFDVGSYPVYGHSLSALDNVVAFRAIVHPDDREAVAATARRAIAASDLVINDFRVIDAEGKVRWLEARSQRVLEDGQPVRLGGMTIDISARKQGEQALAASEERYRVLTELSPQFIWTGAPDGQITYANQGFLDYLGFTAAEFCGTGWLNGFEPEDRTRVHDTWLASVATGELFDIEAQIVNGDTRLHRWWWIRARPLRDAFGKIVNWLGVAVDIHDRKTAVDALREKQLETERQRAELETVYRTAPIGLALFDPVEFRYLRLNDRQAELVGLPMDQILGRQVAEIAPIPGLNEMFSQVARGTPIKNALIEGVTAARPDEHRYWNVNYFPVMSSDGTVRAITAASLEITNQKKAELALIQSEKLAAVGRLASSISHEINNPLEAVTNLLYLIANEPDLPGSAVPFVETAQSELARVSEIARQALRFHRQAVSATWVTAESLVGAVLNLYRGRLVNSNIVIDASYRTQTPVLCFENDIRQVLTNLIANAIDAMRLGGRLIVRAHDATSYSAEHPEGRRGLRIAIADTGHGMPGKVLERIFEPFYTTKALNGTGLGLWISHGIIERHGGQLRIRSSEDIGHRGTVAIIFLPHLSAESDSPTLSSDHPFSS
ncbi:PAS domain-containing protein [Granulicella aggregans]|uniref:PAS domain-containing protein n=1 Tax=Granulicella aggregans TaxID=474949 RepID=UPI0021E01190|nr:PAS domain-containing protein [Granulicella aggregans]